MKALRFVTVFRCLEQRSGTGVECWTEKRFVNVLEHTGEMMMMMMIIVMMMIMIITTMIMTMIIMTMMMMMDGWMDGRWW